MRKTPFPLIKRPVGGVTYEHTLVERLPLDIIIAAAEINLYVDDYHEINLCAYYNARTPNTYDFDNQYYFYQTDGRSCLGVYWNLGIPSRKTKIIKKYNCLEAALSSEYAEYFKTMKERIDKRICEKKAFLEKEKSIDETSYRRGILSKNRGEEFFFICKMTKEYVRVIVNLKKDKWQLITSKEDYGDITHFIPEFDKLDKKILHLQTYHDDLNLKNLDIHSPYYKIIETVKTDLGLPGIIIEHEINIRDVECMEYVVSCYSFFEKKPKMCSKIKIYKDGHVTKIENLENEKDVIQKNVSYYKIKSFYKRVSKFLTSGRLKQDFFCDDSNADLFIYYKEGHKEKYNRGLTRNDVWLGKIVDEFTGRIFKKLENKTEKAKK
jgi:hypothetical protein